MNIKIRKFLVFSCGILFILFLLFSIVLVIYLTGNIISDGERGFRKVIMNFHTYKLDPLVTELDNSMTCDEKIEIYKNSIHDAYQTFILVFVFLSVSTFTSNRLLIYFKNKI